MNRSLTLVLLQKCPGLAFFYFLKLAKAVLSTVFKLSSFHSQFDNVFCVESFLSYDWLCIFLQLAKASIAMVLLVGVIPLLFGLLLEMVVLMPVRVSLNQSPIFFLWQDWALGAMYTKITVSQIYVCHRF